jgi:hypothetical protein
MNTPPQVSPEPDMARRASAPLWVNAVVISASTTLAFTLFLTAWPGPALGIPWVEHLIAPRLIHVPAPLLTWRSALQGSAEAVAGLAAACTIAWAAERLAARCRG